MIRIRAEKFGFSHQTAFNMRHKVLMALQDMLGKEQVTLSGIAELDETFVNDPETAAELQKMLHDIQK